MALQLKYQLCFLIHHVVFKSSKAQGKLSFYTHKDLVAALLKERSKRFQNFLKTFAGLLAIVLSLNYDFKITFLLF